MTTIIMTCKVGKFTFDPGTPYALCKIVRDAVMGQLLQPKQRTMNVRDETDVYNFIRAYEGELVPRVQFQVELVPNVDKLWQNATAEA